MYAFLSVSTTDYTDYFIDMYKTNVISPHPTLVPYQNSRRMVMRCNATYLVHMHFAFVRYAGNAR